MTLSPLSHRIRQTIRRDPINWALACRVNLRPYQRQIALAIKDSILHHRGLTFVIILPRQSGKNELQAHLFAWALFRFAAVGGRIVSVSPTFKPQTMNNMERVSRSLDACLGSRGRWYSTKGYMFCLGRSCIQFFSGDPHARVVGATADLLLSVDEAQEVDPVKFDKDFDPMTASTNATRVFWGTAWTADTLLEHQRSLALHAQQQDGIQRVFFFTAEDVRSLVPDYGLHVDRVIAEKGRNHPLVRSQYFCETIDAQSGMFNPARLSLIFPSVPISPPNSGEIGGSWRGAVAFLIDVAGVDESRLDFASSLRNEGLSNPGRDSSTLTIVAIDLSSLPTLQLPSYRVLARHSWTGQNHVTVFGALKNLVGQWKPLKIVIDSTGVGEGLCSMLTNAFPARVESVKFTSHEKSELGWRFLSIIETGRFHDPSPTDEVRLQYAHCISEVLPGPGKTLRWGVPEGTRAPDGSLIHDDFILADALTAILDRDEWHIPVKSVFIPPPTDPLRELSSHF